MNDSSGRSVSQVVALYGIFATAPTLFLLAIPLLHTLWTQIDTLRRPVPVTQQALVVPAMALLFVLAFGWTPAVAWGVKRRSPEWFLGVLFLVHLASAALAGGVLALLLGFQAVFVGISEASLTGPSGQQAHLYEGDLLYCGYSIYTSEPGAFTSTYYSRTSCECQQPVPPAELAWGPTGPELRNPDGTPYTCPPGCSQSGAPPVGLGLWVLTLTSLRRRRRLSAHSSQVHLARLG